MGTLPNETKGLRVEREENSPFPGELGAVKGKDGQVYTVQPVSQDPKQQTREANSHSQPELAPEIWRNHRLHSALDGIVVIFDAADGESLAAHFSTCSNGQAAPFPG